MGWYRKHFKIPESDRGKQVYIDFDGVYRCSKVWLNGHLLGFRPNGYISFRYDMTPYLKYGQEENVLVVQADNSQQPNSRWYSGSGIYRNVWLVKTGQVHVDQYGTNITTPDVAQERATVVIETTLKNTYAAAVTAELTTIIKAPSGKVIAQTSLPVELPENGSDIIKQTLEVKAPELWGIKIPHYILL